jgi:hypothetical protein
MEIIPDIPEQKRESQRQAQCRELRTGMCFVRSTWRYQVQTRELRLVNAHAHVSAALMRTGINVTIGRHGTNREKHGLGGVDLPDEPIGPSSKHYQLNQLPHAGTRTRTL